MAKREWMESVRLVFDYFCERTPRSFVELRESSVVWNYKYADVEFGRLQARARMGACSCRARVLWHCHACVRPGSGGRALAAGRCARNGARAAG